MSPDQAFIVLVVVAVVLLVALSMFSGTFTVTGDDGFQSLTEFSPGIIGFSSEQLSQVINVGELRVGETQEDVLREALQMDISQNLVGGTQEEFDVRIDLSQLEIQRGVKISFSVLESTATGNLRVVWNGKEVYNAVPSGLTEFVVPPETVKRDNTVRILADGPGIQFWATTFYRMTNVQVILLTGPQKNIPFEMFASDISVFDRGEVNFFGSGSSVLTITVNGAEIFNKVPIGAEDAVFDLGTVPMNAGNNVISFRSSGENLLTGTVIRIFTIGDELSKSRFFDLTEEQLEELQNKEGLALLEVDRVITPGTLGLTLNNNPVNVHTIQRGENNITFPTGYLIEGENTIVLGGSGAYEVSSLVIGVR